MVDILRLEGQSVSGFVAYVKEQVFPKSLKDLDTLKEPSDVRVWRRQHLRELTKMTVVGETFAELVAEDIAAQDDEKVKDSLGTIKSIHIDTIKLMDEYKLVEKEFGGQIEELQKNIEMFKVLHLQMMATDMKFVTDYDQGRIKLL